MEKSKCGVCVVGASNMDLITYVDQLPAPGETRKGLSFQKGFGGKGANQAIACARLGSEQEHRQGKVVMITKLGTDSFGSETIENFRAQGINTEHILTTSEDSSGVAPILVDSKGENSIVIVGGANDLLTVEEVEKARKAIAGCSVLACQLEILPNVTLAALKIAHEEGVTTLFNPAPMQENLSSEFLANTDIICTNETETTMMTGMTITSTEEATAAAKEILKKGPKHVILTLGKRGCLLVDQTKAVHIPSPEVKVVDTTGAGDCFVGSVLYFLSEGKQLEDACRRAVQIAAISVTRKGTQSSYPYHKDIPSELFV